MLMQVLEPLSVTHLDQPSAGEPSARSGRQPTQPPQPTHSQSRSRAKQHQKRGAPVASGYVVYADESSGSGGSGGFERTASDGADPGVVGPAAWQLHQRTPNKAALFSPLCDPVETSDRFAGLLEGAIELYAADTNAGPAGVGLPPGRAKDVRLKTAIPTRWAWVLMLGYMLQSVKHDGSIAGNPSLTACTDR